MLEKYMVTSPLDCCDIVHLYEFTSCDLFQYEDIFATSCKTPFCCHSHHQGLDYLYFSMEKGHEHF